MVAILFRGHAGHLDGARPCARLPIVMPSSRIGGQSIRRGVLIDVAEIMGELMGDAGFSLVKSEAIRSMRTSSQHGGALVLKETLPRAETELTCPIRRPSNCPASPRSV